MYKNGFGINNLQWLMCHQTKPNQTKPNQILSLGQIEQNCVFMLNWIVWNRIVYMYKNGLGINNLQWLMCHQTKSNPLMKGK